MRIKSKIAKSPKTRVYEETLKANTDSFHINIKVVKNGKVVHEERGNSFVANFMRFLAQSMAIGPIDYDYDFSTVTPINPGCTKFDSWLWVAPMYNKTGGPGLNAFPEPVLITGFPASNRINTQHQVNLVGLLNQIRDAHYVYISNSIHSGVYEVLDSGGITGGSWFELDGLDADPSDPAGALVFPLVPYNPQMGTNTTHLRAWFIALGNNDTPVAIDDKWLYSSFTNSEMVPSGSIDVSPPVISANVSRIAMSITFTNNTGVEATIREIGLMTRNSLYHTATSGVTVQNAYLKRDGLLSATGGHTAVGMVARDVLSSTGIPVAPSETFSIIYEIVTSIAGDTNSGIMENFNELLYRQLATNTRTARNYFNSQIDAGVSRFQFYVPENDHGSFGAGAAPYGRFNTAYYGILLGSEEGVVDADDYFVKDNASPPNDVIIPLGTDTGKLVYFPTKYVDFELGANNCFLVFERIVENRSGGSIEVKQIGFSVAAGQDFLSPTLISRKNLGVDSFTIADGERYAIRYKIGIEVGGS